MDLPKGRSCSSMLGISSEVFAKAMRLIFTCSCSALVPVLKRAFSYQYRTTWVTLDFLSWKAK